MKTVLLLDDARSVRSVFGELIRKAGLEAHTASTAEEGFQYIQEHGAPDLIVTDINMPGITGLEFCRRVRHIEQSVPILVLSAQSDRSLIQEAQQAGVNGWMLKPVEPEYFMNRVMSALAQ
ncbi:PleD family two-component system response regulator [Limnobacter sp.]|uniref:response regulator n=1 Tax=Limnobacter sp. TaxID=2003368 RepID=UPI003519D6EC